jgi:hypothetical protein
VALRILKTACVFALLLTGCGGGDEPERPSGVTAATTSESSKPLSKNEYLARGDAICADAQSDLGLIKRRADEARKLPPSQQASEAAAIWHEQLEVAQTYKARFLKLQAPAEDRPRVQEFLRALDEGIRLSRKIIVYLDDRREPPRELFVDYGRVVDRGNTLAQAYGFQVCGRGSG